MHAQAQNACTSHLNMKGHLFHLLAQSLAHAQAPLQHQAFLGISGGYLADARLLCGRALSSPLGRIPVWHLDPLHSSITNTQVAQWPMTQ